MQGQCSSGFGPRGSELHQGQDIAVPIGTPILAALGSTAISRAPRSFAPAMDRAGAAAHACVSRLSGCASGTRRDRVQHRAPANSRAILDVVIDAAEVSERRCSGPRAAYQLDRRLRGGRLQGRDVVVGPWSSTHRCPRRGYCTSRAGRVGGVRRQRHTGWDADRLLPARPGAPDRHAGGWPDL